jgi:4-hydroxyphenylpyruvate dioxygenase
VFNDAFRRSDNRRTARDALRSLIALEDDVHRGLAADHAGRPVRVRLSPPPAAPAPTGFAFAEVAAAPGGELDALLVALGFAHTGRHRSKPVHLWEQGHARILVNGADGGPCPAVAAIGLESPDPMRAVERAEGLLSPVLPRQRGADEVRLDAVAAPDGTALFFCRTGHADHADWRQDFLPVEPTTTAAAGDGGEGHAGRVGRGDGIAHIDHVALTQPPHRFDEAALFYRSVLCLRPHDSVELADPYGLLRSRAVSGPGDGVRIALNVADVDHDRHDPADASQHVALASDDIVATARRLRARRAPLLEVPDNYYDDLEARHDLAAGLVTTLRELGLLYDRDEHGEFLHLYTQTVGQVFFEIVQRVDHYAGYGAHNAPVRLTAQHAARAA